MLMKALKTFRVGSTQQVVGPGDEFETTNTKDYEMRGMAVLVKPRGMRTVQPVANKAAGAGPLPSPGGATGEDKSPSSSPADPAPKTRGSRKPAGGHES